MATPTERAKTLYQETSQKGRIMDDLRTRALGDRPPDKGTEDLAADVAKHGGRRKGFTHATVRTIAKDLGYSQHDVTHALYDLRNRGLLRFKESKSPGDGKGTGDGGGATRSNGIPIYIGVTPKGMEPAALVKDLDERIDVLEVAADIVADKPTVVRPPNQNEKKPQAEPRNVVEHILGRSLEPEPLPTPLLRRPELPPILASLMARDAARTKARDAAKALESVGLLDQALALLEALPANDLESAMAEHLRLLGYGAMEVTG
jgi:hypothetical protein